MDVWTETLLARLEIARSHVLEHLEGLSDEQLRRPVLPSGWSCLGLLKHLSLADEHYWFRCIVGGEPLSFFDDIPNEWMVDPSESVESIFDLYRGEIARSNEIIGARLIDTPTAQRDPRWDDWNKDFPTLGVVLLHVMTETDVHSGHLDAVVELLDGRQWIVMG